MVMKRFSLQLEIWEEDASGDMTDVVQERTLFRSSSLPDILGLYDAVAGFICNALRAREREERKP